MYLIVIAWLYVTLLMALAEAFSSQGSVLGAIITFLLYGALPMSLVVYLWGAPSSALSSGMRANASCNKARTCALSTRAGGAPSTGSEGVATVLMGHQCIQKHGMPSQNRAEIRVNRDPLYPEQATLRALACR